MIHTMVFIESIIFYQVKTTIHTFWKLMNSVEYVKTSAILILNKYILVIIM